jgi:hypothetical protein
VKRVVERGAGGHLGAPEQTVRGATGFDGDQ